MQCIETNIPDVKIFQPKIFGDDRGFFLETFRYDEFCQHIGTDRYTFVQDNHSSSSKGVLRGLHFQKIQPQGKLVRVLEGEIFDVCVDIRRDSDTYGQWVGVNLDTTLHQQLWIPPGFAHGFYVQSDQAQIVYKCTDYYHPQSEVSIHYNDSELSINWPITTQPVLSEKDAQGVAFNYLD